MEDEEEEDEDEEDTERRRRKEENTGHANGGADGHANADTHTNTQRQSAQHRRTFHVNDSAYIYICTKYDQARSWNEPSALTPSIYVSFLASDMACIYIYIHN